MLSTDREDQLHASLARGNQSKPLPFKRPAPQAKQPASGKKDKKSPFQSTVIPPPASGRSFHYPKGKGRGRLTKSGGKDSKPSTGRGCPAKEQP